MTERLLDSVILIDHLNGINKATRFVSDLDPQKTAISVITRAEVLVGVGNSRDSGQGVSGPISPSAN